MKTKLLLLVAFSCAMLSFAQVSKEKAVRVNLKDGVAIQGYDPVAYFEKNEAIKGKKEFSSTKDGITYYFESEKNKTLYLKNPSKFQPQYGGFCAFGMSNGYEAPVDPTAFTIVNNKLYLNYNHEVKLDWVKTKEDKIQKANAHWVKK